MSDTPRTDALFKSLHLPPNNDIPVEIALHAMRLEKELSAQKRRWYDLKSNIMRRGLDWTLKYMNNLEKEIKP